jgi:hypothetical protein
MSYSKIVFSFLSIFLILISFNHTAFALRGTPEKATQSDQVVQKTKEHHDDVILEVEVEQPEKKVERSAKTNEKERKNFDSHDERRLEHDFKSGDRLPKR